MQNRYFSSARRPDPDPSAVDMLSDLSCDTLPCNIPFDAQPHEDPLAPLDFDDLLDIAREFEFTHTITHLWPCDEPSPETGLDDILATIIPSPETEGVHLEKPDVQISHLVPDDNASVFKTSILLPKCDDQVRSEAVCPTAPTVRGWSPPNGSQFLDLDDGLTLPQPATDAWLPPCLTPFLVPSYAQLMETTNQSSATFQAIEHAQPATDSKDPPTSIADSPRRDSAPRVIPPVSSVNPDPSQARPTPPVNLSVPPQTAITPVTKTAKYRMQLPSAPGTGTTKHARAPRGGIPPHIARTVTKANVLRIEKERKVMEDAFSSTNSAAGKKPSVLRRTIDMVRETKGKDQFGLRGNLNEKKGRATKRVKV